MEVLGLGGSNHDFSAALIKDGRILVAIEDERIVRRKRGDNHWASSPCEKAANYCLEEAGQELGDIERIFVNIDTETASPFWSAFKHELVPHHLCHAAAAFYTSPFEDAALLVIDGRGASVGFADDDLGEFETISIGRGRGEAISLETLQVGQQKLTSSSWSYITSNSIGWFYRIVTLALGFDPGGEGKTMGLAAFGSAAYLSALGDFYSINDGRFEFNPYSGIWDFLYKEINSARNSFQVRADLAASAQRILEEAVFAAALHARRQNGNKHLCLGGGVALNGAANHRLRQEAGFDEIFVFPASGDNGLAVGAALYGYHARLGGDRIYRSNAEISMLPFCGRCYSDHEIEIALANSPLHYRKAKNAASELVDRLVTGECIAVFQGESEFGPRALGHRSILADPTARRVRDRVNQIKRRESFRPLAPVILESCASDYFDLEGPSPFMLEIASVKPRHRDLLAGVTHVDGTARVQTVPEGGDRLLVDALHELRTLGRAPVLLNTSFNLNGKPIVESPTDAVEAFLLLDLDALLLGPFWVEKHTPFAPRRGF